MVEEEPRKLKHEFFRGGGKGYSKPSQFEIPGATERLGPDAESIHQAPYLVSID